MSAGEGLTVYVPFASGYFEFPEDYGKYFEGGGFFAGLLSKVSHFFVDGWRDMSPFVRGLGFFLGVVLIVWIVSRSEISHFETSPIQKSQ